MSGMSMIQNSTIDCHRRHQYGSGVNGFLAETNVDFKHTLAFVNRDFGSMTLVCSAAVYMEHKR
jgi:hypothetical protein